MSEPPTAHSSLSATGFEDGLGRRTLEFDREAGGMIERLRVRPELGAFEGALRQRMDRLAAFDDARFARVRAVERDATGAVSVLSTYVAGDRLCDLLDAATGLPAHEATSPSVDAALGFLLEALSALEAFHSATGLAHGAVATTRIALTPAGDVVLLDTLYGQVLERLQMNRRRLWTEFGLALPVGGSPRFDRNADISQASLAAMMIVLGRPFGANDYPEALPDLITEVIEIAQIRGSSGFASELHKFLHRSLPLPARRAHASADEAAVEVRQIAREIGVQRCRAALTAFVGDMNRVIADARAPQPVPERAAAVDVSFEPSLKEPFEIDEPLFVPQDAEPAPPERTADRVPEPLADREYEPAAASGRGENAADFVEEPVPSQPEPAPAFEERPGPAYEEPQPVMAARAEPEPVVTVRSEPVTPITERAPQVELDLPVLVAATVVSPPPPIAIAAPPAAPVVEPAFVPVPAAPVPAIEPAKPIPVAAAPAAPEADPAESRRGRRNARRHRDKLRSNAAPTPPAATTPVVAAPPPPPPAPPRPPLVAPMPAYAAVMPMPGVSPTAPPPRKAAQPLRDEAPIPQPFAAPIRVDPPAAPPQPIAPLAFRGEPAPKPEAFKSDTLAFKSEPMAFKSEPLGFKNAPTSGFSPSSARTERREAPHEGGFRDYATPEPKRTMPWRFVAAALVVVAVGVGAGRKYLPSSTGAAEAAPMPSSEVVDAAKIAAATERSGTLVLTTEPAGAHVLLDGKEMGDSPLTLENVPAGRHALTFVTASATVRKAVRVEAGKTAALDVAVFSGWIAVYSPIPLDIAENGKPIGSSEQGRLMLSPGRHQLTMTNTELGYRAVQTVDIEAGEERPVSVQPTGELSANAVPWAEVWMNGKKMGETPVAGLMVPLGTHEVVFRNPQFPERHVSVTVTASTPVTASVDFSK